MGQFVLGVDAGGTSLKVGIYSLDGEERGLIAFPFPPLRPQPGFHERDADLLWTSLGESIKASLAKAGLTGADIAVVGLTGYGNGLYLVDERGRPTANGILSYDQRAADFVAQWQADGTDDQVLALTANRFWVANAAPLIAWFKANRPEVLKASAWALTCKDYLRFRLTGEVAAEITEQCSWTMNSAAARDREPRVFALTGLEDQLRLLPRIVEPASIAGAVTREAAALTGLREGTPVAAGCCDNVAVMIGTGAVANGSLVIMSGTWGLNQIFLERHAVDGAMGVVVHGLDSRHWLHCLGSPGAASSFEWFVDTFVRKGDSPEPPEAAYERCSAAFARTDASDDPVFFFPFLEGAYDDDRARASLIGFSSRHHLGHAVRAVYEGVAFEQRRHFERLIQSVPRPVAARFCGGPARSRAWTEIFASALDLTLEIPRGAEFGCRGVAMLAAVVSNLVPGIDAAVAAMTSISHTVAPHPRLRSLLDARYPTYRELHAALGPHWRAG